MIKAKIIGAGGFGGVGIVELLTNHPEVEIKTLVAIESVGNPISDTYPHLKGFCDLVILPPTDSKAQEPADIVFMATPDGVGMKLAGDELAKGAKVIDYSGDFRFNSKEIYADYAARIGKPTEHLSPELLPQAVYGLPELHRNDINKETQIIGNPGCFAVSCLLGLAPAVKEKLITTDSIICDCKTGISGAGKKPAATFHYPMRYENMNAYKLAGHQHVCEVEHELGLLAGSDIKITFTSQVVPLCRGIMSTLYGTLANNVNEQDIIDIYKDFYGTDSFVNIYPATATIGTQNVRGSNNCNIVISVDERTSRLRVISYIDNLVKGQAGSAMQNMNIIMGLPEKTGFDRPGMYP
jgi:N-acetyl-gamma-glutamyl-phosphate reductase